MKQYNVIKPRHPYHMVTPSPWPLITSIVAFIIPVGLTMYMHLYRRGGFLLTLGIFLLIAVLSFWWRDVIREGTFEGMHTKAVQRGLKIGMILFILSEFMFFFAFIWACLHVSFSPTFQIGCIWPPPGIIPPSPVVGFFGTILLTVSAFYIEYAHLSIRDKNNVLTVNALAMAAFFGFAFTVLQVFEYFKLTFSISDSVFGSTFYMLTGLHGFHVIIGTIFIVVCFFRALKGHFSASHHVGFEAAQWYWTFVDWVWFFVFGFFYIWSNNYLSFLIAVASIYNINFPEFIYYI